MNGIAMQLELFTQTVSKNMPSVASLEEYEKIVRKDLRNPVTDRQKKDLQQKLAKIYFAKRIHDAHKDLLKEEQE